MLVAVYTNAFEIPAQPDDVYRYDLDRAARYMAQSKLYTARAMRLAPSPTRRLLQALMEGQQLSVELLMAAAMPEAR